MIEVSRQQLQEKIRAITGSMFVKFVAETEVGLTGGKGNPYQGATKIAHVSGQLGKDYEVAVNNQLAREDKDMGFNSQAPKGKAHTDCKHLLVDEKTGTKTYLIVYPSPKSQERVEANPTKYYFNGEEIDVEVLIPTFKPVYANKSQGTDKPIIYRTYNINSILSMTLNKIEYVVVEGQGDVETTPVTRETVEA